MLAILEMQDLLTAHHLGSNCSVGYETFEYIP